LAEYCDEHGLPLRRTGKVILPGSGAEDAQLDELVKRARGNGADVCLIDEQQLKELEPAAESVTGRALYSPGTSIVEPRSILQQLGYDLRSKGVDIRTGSALTIEPNPSRAARIGGDTISYGLLVNAAGLHADRIAHALGVGRQYSILPFRGVYFRLAPDCGYRVRSLIYPVPDLRVPFLGIHFTTTLDDATYLGPSALPAFGRENYEGLSGVEPLEGLRIAGNLSKQYIRNRQGFRALVHQEAAKVFRKRLAAAARALVPAVRPEHLLRSDKTGIRAQLLNRGTGNLEMDFVVERGDRSIHLLNAVSPAFTSAFSFARQVAGTNDGF
jgi:L-2-hydroxyglutarate oxidase LhgO